MIKRSMAESNRTTVHIVTAWLLTMVAVRGSLLPSGIPTHDFAPNRVLYDHIQSADPTRFGVFHDTIAYHFQNGEHNTSYGILHVLYRAWRVSDALLEMNGCAYWEDSGDLNVSVGAGSLFTYHVVAPKLWMRTGALQLQLYTADNESATGVGINTAKPASNLLPATFNATVPVLGAESLRLRVELNGVLWPHYIPIAPAVHYAMLHPSVEGYKGSTSPTFFTVLRAL